MLVVSDRLPSPVILHVRSRGVQAVPMARLQESGRGLVLQRGEALADLGSFEVDKTDIKFSHGSVAAVLRPKPSLVGAHTLAELYEHTPKYKTDAAAYAPDPAIVDKLRSVGGDYHVKFVFGSWCRVCKQYLPRGLAVVEALSGAPIKFEYLGSPARGSLEHARGEAAGGEVVADGDRLSRRPGDRSLLRRRGLQSPRSASVGRDRALAAHDAPSSAPTVEARKEW